MEQGQTEVCGTVLSENDTYSNKNANQPFNKESKPSPEQPRFERHVTGLERQLLLNNCAVVDANLSNWTKVFLSALAVIIPGIGQLVGIIVGLVMVANDSDSDRRSYGAALLTVSVLVFLIQLIFWFLFALSVGPDFYYY